MLSNTNSAKQNSSEFHKEAIESSMMLAADAANSKVRESNKTLGNTESGWRQTMSSAALGIAGTATAVGLSGLAFYAYHRMGAASSLVVDPGSIQGIAEYGATNIQAGLNGLGQVHSFIEDVMRNGGNRATMGDVFDKLQRSGVAPEMLKDAIDNHASLLGGGSSNVKWAEKLVDPTTPLSPATLTKLTEVVWYHDKQAALSQSSATDAMAFAKAGLATTMASISSAAASNMDAVKSAMKHFKQAGHRIALEFGLINDSADRQVRKAIKVSAFDPIEARARLASEYAERQNPSYRFFTLHWVDAANAGDRQSMLQLFGMEPLSLGGKHTTVGQAVMIDHFCAKDMRELANQEPQYAPALEDLARRRERMEQRGLRPNSPTVISAEVAQPMPNRGIGQMVDEYVQLRRVRTPAAAFS